jgi:hypothetical protein
MKNRGIRVTGLLLLLTALLVAAPLLGGAPGSVPLTNQAFAGVGDPIMPPIPPPPPTPPRLVS